MQSPVNLVLELNHPTPRLPHSQPGSATPPKNFFERSSKVTRRFSKLFGVDLLTLTFRNKEENRGGESIDSKFYGSEGVEGGEEKKGEKERVVHLPFIYNSDRK